MINNANRSGAVSDTDDLEKRARAYKSERSGKSSDTSEKQKVKSSSTKRREIITVVNGKLTVITR